MRDDEWAGGGGWERICDPVGDESVSGGHSEGRRTTEKTFGPQRYTNHCPLEFTVAHSS